MTRYQNGRIPAHELVHMGDEHYATPATRARIEALIADIWESEGVRVYVSPGRNIYRDYESQVDTKNWAISIGKAWIAAAAGHSSHGGTFNGKDALAVDFSGYGPLGLDKWFRYLRKHGFEANYYDGKEGRPLEPWHAIDWNPYSAPAPAGEAATITITDTSEEDDMKLLFVTDSVDGNNIPGWALLNTRTGKLVTLRADNPDNQARANGWARVWGDAKSVTRQDMLNAVAAIQQTA